MSMPQKIIALWLSTSLIVGFLQLVMPECVKRLANGFILSMLMIGLRRIFFLILFWCCLNVRRWIYTGLDIF